MELEFKKPKNLDGAKLIIELTNAKIVIAKEIRNQFKVPRLDGEGKLWLDIDESDYEAAKVIVASHNGSNTDKSKTILG
jgi:hypothetical protein